MSKGHTIVLDTEAIQALMDQSHRKHRRIVAVVESASARNVRRAGWMRLIVPTTVRVEAAWDRRQPSAARINQYGIADAHLAAVLSSTGAGSHAVVTSDRKDLGRIAAHLGITVEIVPV